MFVWFSHSNVVLVSERKNMKNMSEFINDQREMFDCLLFMLIAFNVQCIVWLNVCGLLKYLTQRIQRDFWIGYSITGDRIWFRMCDMLHTFCTCNLCIIFHLDIEYWILEWQLATILVDTVYFECWLWI